MYAMEWSKYKPIDFELIKENTNMNISKLAPLVWAEHCIECAVPLCYKTCLLYKKREDGKCKLFTNGLLKRKEFAGILGYGIEVEFENWSKIEANCNVGQYPIWFIKIFDKIFNTFSNISYCLSKIFEENRENWIITTINYKIREGISLLLGMISKKPDYFMIRAINTEKNVISIIMEIRAKTRIKYRNIIQLENGITEYIIAYQDLNITKNENHKILFYLEDRTKIQKIILTILDFVKFKKYSVNENIINNDKKIKCIVWDLDNTLWNGILIEDKEIKLNDDIINIIIELDKRGIFSSIVSKNDYDLAYSKLKEFQIDGYFVFPKINWDPKSVNIKQLSIDTNIGLDTIAFVDDNPFERDEVKNVCPDVLCIDVKDVNTILNMKEFDVIITSDTVKRRKTYKMIEEQKKEIEKWNGNIDDFIKSCNMKLLIRKPKIDELVRCYELIQRTNQLNSSGRRLSIIDIENIYNNKNYETYILQCEDKYGDYGIVGFSIVHIIEQPIITDFVISCRVANRKVENAYIIYLVEKYKKMGYLKLSINYKKTIKNGPIFNVIKDLNMLKGENEDVNIESYYILLKNDVIKLSIIEVIDNFESI